MFRYLKRKHMSGEEDDDNESQVPQPNTSKGKMSDVKKNRLYNELSGHFLYMDWRRKLSTSYVYCLWGKTSLTHLWPQPSQSNTSVLVMATCERKQWIIFKDLDSQQK